MDREKQASSDPLVNTGGQPDSEDIAEAATGGAVVGAAPGIMGSGAAGALAGATTAEEMGGLGEQVEEEITGDTSGKVVDAESAEELADAVAMRENLDAMTTTSDYASSVTGDAPGATLGGYTGSLTTEDARSGSSMSYANLDGDVDRGDAGHR